LTHEPGIRSYFSTSDAEVGGEPAIHTVANPITVAHELGHAIELSRPDAVAASVAFVRARGKGSRIAQLNELAQGSGYDDSELAYDDGFMNPYSGKVYDYAMSEVVPMGLQEITQSNGGANLLAKDPEHFWFTLGQLRDE
jgi:hypothetical protein